MAAGGPAETTARALQVAIAVADRLGLGRLDAVILRNSHHVSIRLLPLDVVARVAPADQPEAAAALRREIAIAQHLSARAAPTVRPTDELPAGPHFWNGFGLTFWQYLDHVAADEDNGAHVAVAAQALRRVQDALTGFPGALPSFHTKIAGCRALLDDRSALTALPTADRAFLTEVYDRFAAALDDRVLQSLPIHGDAHLGNVFIATDGSAYWNDFEDVCLGPREWDMGWLSDADLGPFEPVDRDLLALLSDLRSWCVAIWCWASFALPEKRAAAEYHLDRLRRRYG